MHAPDNNRSYDDLGIEREGAIQMFSFYDRIRLVALRMPAMYQLRNHSAFSILKARALMITQQTKLHHAGENPHLARTPEKQTPKVSMMHNGALSSCCVCQLFLGWSSALFFNQ